MIGIAAAMLMVLPALMFATPVRAEGDAWTVMVYMAGDNTLTDAVAVDMGRAGEPSGSTADVNFVVLADTADGPAYMYYVNQGSSTVIASWGEVNTADPAMLTKFITDAKTAYPANNYVLDFWNHGGGIMGVCWDDTSGDKITMLEMRTAVVNGGVSFANVWFDACNMAQAEIAHQLQGYASYVVFSEQTVWGQGFPYDAIATHLVASPTMDGRTLSLIAADEFTVFFTALGWNTCTISVYDMAYLTTVSGAVQTFAGAMVSTMNLYYKTYKSCRGSAAATAGAVDLMGFAQLVSANTKLSTTVRNAASATVTAVDLAIIYEWHSKDCAGMNGLGIWYPTSSVSYYWSASVETMYRGMLFDQATGWANFLDAYYAKA